MVLAVNGLQEATERDNFDFATLSKIFESVHCDEEGKMPVILIILLNFLGWFVVATLVVGPLDFLKLIKLPAWLLVSLVLIIFFWYFGE